MDCAEFLQVIVNLVHYHLLDRWEIDKHCKLVTMSLCKLESSLSSFWDSYILVTKYSLEN